MKREIPEWLLGLSWALAFFVGWWAGLRIQRIEMKPTVEFSGEPSRGVFVPGPSTTRCLVAVTGDDPAVWHYRIWREDDPSKALTGKGTVVVP